MNRSRFYIIVVQDKKDNFNKVSQEAYHEYENAKRFILSRYDRPEERSRFFFESEEYKYLITDVQVAD